jgi:hypothetical protein
MVRDCLDLYGIAAPSDAPFGKLEKETFELALDIGHSLVHDGDKYLASLDFVDRGAELLWRILRYARVNGIVELEQKATEAFEWAAQHRTPDAEQLLDIYREHAKSGEHRVPELPDDLIEKLSSYGESI